MSDLVYKIKNVFSIDPREGALGQREAEKYYIAPYQRGYKWGSSTPNDAVWILMTDLFDAFEGKEDEYYLQYITIKKNIINDLTVLEVIDGQQRLTTLTLLYSVLKYHLKGDQPTVTSHKLKYGVRDCVDDFLIQFIYNDIEFLLNTSWDKFSYQYPNYNIQDVFYMFNAVNCINDQLSKHNSLNEFKNFLSNNVMIILNFIDKGSLASEKIFSNLNTNKVELTSTELVKGLLLTRAGREKDDIEGNRHFKEILELRATMGRQWDEIANWVERPEIKSFYFSKYSESMDGLLYLLGTRYKYSKNLVENKYALFNFFQALIKREGIKAQTLFIKLQQLYSILKDWFENPQIHNMLGFLFSYKCSNFTLTGLIPLLELNKVNLKEQLSNIIIHSLDFDTSDLSYGITNDNIHNVLLFINVFGTDTKFNFKEFSDRKWSLEHIFPQHPNFLPDYLGDKDINLLNTFLQENWKSKANDKLSVEFDEVESCKIISSLGNKLKGKSCHLNIIEKELLYFCINKTKLNSIGNMALLTSSDNSSNSNGLFDSKRHNIVSLISKGSFVPKHTYDVFSKLLSSAMEPDLRVWSEKDIDAHEVWLNGRVNQIKGELVR